MKNYFPDNLKHLRNQKGLTQEDLAKKMDKDYSTIGKWELGQRNPIMADILKLADIFGVSVQDLVEKDLRFNEEIEKNEVSNKQTMLFNKIKDLPPEKQQIILNVTENLIKEIDKELDGQWKFYLKY